MIVLRIILKLPALLLLMPVNLVKWVMIFMTGFSSVIYFLIAGLALASAALGYLMGISDQTTALETAAAGFLFFMIPVIGGWIADALSTISGWMVDFVRS